MASGGGPTWDVAATHRLAMRLGNELVELVDMYHSGHPELVEMVGRRVGQMCNQERMQMLLLAISVLAMDDDD